MNTPSEVDSLLFWLTPEQWTEVNGLASSITALAAVVGVALAFAAVVISRKSTWITRRTYMDRFVIDLFDRLDDFERRVSTALERRIDVAEKSESEGRSLPAVDISDLELLRHRDSVVSAIRLLEMNGITVFDKPASGRKREISFSESLSALESLVDARFELAHNGHCAYLLARSSVTYRETWEALEPDLLRNTEPAGGVVIKETFAFRLEQIFPGGETAHTEEIVKNMVDAARDFVAERYAVTTHRVAPWLTHRKKAAPPRGWTKASA